jgi:hypothetical protein
VGFTLAVEVGWLWVGVGLVVQLLEWRVLNLLLLAKDLDGVPELLKCCSCSMDVLPSSFDTLGYCLPSCDSVLFLTEPFNFLLNSGELCFFCDFIFRGVIPGFYAKTKYSSYG